MLDSLFTIVGNYADINLPAGRPPWRVERGERALDLLERWLAPQSWLAADAFTIADIALLAYTRLAPEGGFDLSTRPNVRAWIHRCELELGLK